ncbi:MAG: TonB-dependent receptor [Bacteroidales bacterium]
MKKVFTFTSLGFIAFQSIGATTSTTDSVSNIVNLNEVVIKATRASELTPVAQSNVSKEQLSNSNFGQDVPYLISQTPSVVVTSDAGTGIGYTGYRVRGTDANRINVTVNGVPVNDSESHTVFWVNMPDFASSVENIQIQRGAGTSTNGAASFGATIGMQTQKPELKPYAELNSAVGSFMTFKNTFRGGTGLLYDHFVFDARYSKLDSDGFIDRSKADMSSYYASAAYYAGSSLIRYQTFGSNERTGQAWNYVPGDSIRNGNRTFNSCGRYTLKDEYGMDILDENGNKIYQFYDQTDNYRQQHHHLTAAHRFENNWDVNMTLHYTNGKGYYEDYKENAKLVKYNLNPFTSSNGNKIKRTDLVRRKWLRNDFYGVIASADYQKNNFRLTLGGGINNYEGKHTGNVIWARNYNNLSPDHIYYDSDAQKLDYNFYAKVYYNFTSNLSTYVDMQYRGINYKVDGTNDNFDYEDIQQQLNIHKHFNFFNPKAGLNYNRNGHNAFASFAIANREPNRNNYTDAGINELPTHETLYDYEAGYSFSGKTWNVGMNLYYMNYKNQLILTGKLSEIGEALTSNIPDSYRMGIELMGGVRICKGFEWNGNIALSANKIRNFTETVDEYSLFEDEKGNSYEDWSGTREVFYNKTTIAMSPSIVANSIFSFNKKGFHASFNSVFVSRQYLDNSSNKSRSLDPYFVNHLQMGYTFKPTFMKEIALAVRINNLFNAKYETNGWVYSYINEQTGHTNSNRVNDDGLATQAGTNVMAALTLKF